MDRDLHTYRPDELVDILRVKIRTMLEERRVTDLAFQRLFEEHQRLKKAARAYLMVSAAEDEQIQRRLWNELAAALKA